jgi:hypothetical protein
VFSRGGRRRGDALCCFRRIYLINWRLVGVSPLSDGLGRGLLYVMVSGLYYVCK